MSVSASRSIGVTFSGDVTGTETYSATSNTLSPGKIDLVSLASGNNVLTVPAITGFTAVAVTIIPPAGNVTLITAKGTNADTGIPLHKTDPSSIAIDTTATTVVLNAASTINGVRVIWN